MEIIKIECNKKDCNIWMTPIRCINGVYKDIRDNKGYLHYLQHEHNTTV